jgi:hypothetical protein
VLTEGLLNWWMAMAAAPDSESAFR